MKVIQIGKFAALSAYIKKLKSSHISNLVTHLKALEQQEETIPRNNRWEEIKQIKAEINKLETSTEKK